METVVEDNRQIFVKIYQGCLIRQLDGFNLSVDNFVECIVKYDDIIDILLKVVTCTLTWFKKGFTSLSC